jgi:DNA invertase Pin-like site-specific DNA recombinase
MPAVTAKPIAVYMRVSTTDQSTASQKSEVMRWIEANGIDANQVQWFVDEGFTGRKIKRPAFDRLQEEIFMGAVTTVVVYKLDRLSRTMMDGFVVVQDWCKRGVRLVSTSEKIDLTGVIGQMIAAVIMGISEIEWQYRKERQKAGIEAAQKRGVLFGRPRGTGKAIKVTPEVRAEVFRMKGERGHKVAAIARLLNLSRNTVYGIVRGGAGGDTRTV